MKSLIVFVTLFLLSVIALADSQVEEGQYFEAATGCTHETWECAQETADSYLRVKNVNEDQSKIVFEATNFRSYLNRAVITQVTEVVVVFRQPKPQGSESLRVERPAMLVIRDKDKTYPFKVVCIEQPNMFEAKKTNVSCSTYTDVSEITVSYSKHES